MELLFLFPKNLRKKIIINPGISIHLGILLVNKLNQEFLHYFFPELLTKAMDLLSGDHEGTLIVPCPPYI